MEPTNQPSAPDYGPPPDYSAWPAYQPVVATPKPARSRLKTALGGLALAGLLVVGGAASAFAASPSPDASGSPAVTTPERTDNGTTTQRGDCPHDKTTTDDSTSTESSS